MWFLFVKLALELEEKNTTLIVKEKFIHNGVLISKRKTKKIRINRKKYEGWDLDDILNLNFDKWWKPHRVLFLDEGIRVLSTDDVIDNDPDYLYVKIDTRRRATDVIADLRAHLKKHERHKTQTKFQILGNPRPAVLQNRYNALVLKINNELSDQQILDPKNRYMRPTKLGMNEYSVRDTGRTMFDLISGSERSFGAKQILLSVCDGYFVKHPTKTYLE
jgi:hypothetical protein